MAIRGKGGKFITAGQRRRDIGGAVGRENRAIRNRPSGWTAREAQRKHRGNNARAVSRLKAAGRVV
ncbi:hypothetical protein CMU68_10110 [Elizabethkingia anophelis]|uniref:Uncharacterized protein n=1 Tax=Elizabethkingia anophelis TaxID=1117645 RepID=A0AAU8VC71_9FLAO|nr:hypothetical protein BBD32_02655 [Elizabethkingia anophelis]MDV3585545.1 hypothetical protein [Elizabethkingia anophelis]MDV3751186.1 hypothetical protein [Elizabethkingia anophelis]MDV3786240.1 hypothetical protein [Elizabethkingia anophelis]OPB66208.1 hypothetical protein BAY11_14685 [Elizabethkingia anophelis]